MGLDNFVMKLDKIFISKMVANIEEMALDNLPIDAKNKVILSRRINKLKQDPKGFFKHSLEKRKKQIKKQLPIKYNGSYQYTVVSAVYNVEKYLDDYFKSLVNQSLNFKKHIQLILVDDGSTDNSAQIIKKWQKKYPKNIHYYYKENGGISSARNFGLQYVQTEWVTFIDSDDFVEHDYFKVVDDELSKDNSIEMVVGNLRFYFEDNKLIQDTHSLNYRFKKEVNKVDMTNLDTNINLFVTVSFFKTEYLKKYNIVFDDRIKPNFEDGKFLADYFLSVNKGKVAYLKNALFNYRKRGDGSSTIDASWTKREKFYNLQQYGYIPLLQSYQAKLGYIPKNIQWTILYEFSWHLKILINQTGKLYMLTDEEIQQYYELFRKILTYIDVKEILDFNLLGIWFMYKVGILGAFKDKKPNFQIAYVENLDRIKKQILVVYYSYFDVPVSYQINGEDILPKHFKVTNRTFANNLFVFEYRAWIPYESYNQNDTLQVEIDGKNARVSLFGKQHSQGLRLQDIFERYAPSDKYTNDGSWVLMDRDTQADDNAEHLYRYIAKNHPEQQIYFALNQDSHDWDRLYHEGFNLLPYSTAVFEEHLRACNTVVSSHFDDYIYNYFGDEYGNSKKFIFLQHGIIKDDLSRWMNYKKNLACFITTTQAEYNSIVSNGTTYQLSDKEVIMAGLPRHDALLQFDNKQSKIILIMPTWRAGVLGKATKVGNEREYNPNFMQTGYAQHWQSLLLSDRLKQLVQDYDYQVIFAPHANIVPYLNLFKIPSYVSVWWADKSNNTIQSLFQNAIMMITDYSSVAFEMALLGKLVLYYQFDPDYIFSEKHIYQKGYFDYDRDGFGPVAQTEKALLDNLEKTLKNNGKPFEPYATRIRDTFPFRDGKNCERVYQAIVALDEPDDGSVNAEILAQAVVSARKHKVWHLIESRLLKQIELNLINELDLFNIQQEICQAMYMQGKYKVLLDYLPTTKLNIMQQKYWQVKLDFWLGDYQILQDYFIQNKATSIEDGILNLLACSYLHDQKGFDDQKQWLLKRVLSPAELSMLNIAELVLQGQDFEICTFADSMLTDDELIWQLDEMRLYKPLLIGAKSAIVLREFDLCLKYIRAYEKKVSGDYASRLILAQQDFAKDSYKWATVHYEKLIEWGVDLPKIDYIHYIESLYYTKQDIKIENYSLDLELILANNNLLDMWMSYQSAKKNWQTILNVLDKFNDEQKQKFIYLIVLSYCRTGQVEKAYEIYKRPELADSYEYWELIAELAILMGDKELAKYCYRTMAAVFPEKNKEVNLRLLQSL